MDGISEHDLSKYSSKKPRISYQDKVTNTARNRLSGALQVAITNKDDRDDDGSSIGDMSPIKRPLGLGTSPFASPAKSPSKGVRRRKRHDPDKNSAFHHTFVMKLFDRSVDLAQFREGTPLYPVCRAWMKNEPTNTEQGPRHRTPTPGPDDEDEDLDESEDEDKSNSVFKLPQPDFIVGDGKSPRIPPPPLQLIEGLDMDLDQTDAPDAKLLLSNHMVRWWGVKKSWKQASIENEARYSESMKILKDMFEK